MRTYQTIAEVATVWVSPKAPRAVDAAAVADEPDVHAWTAGLDAQARLGLHGRTLTQLLRGEPALVLQRGPSGWVRIAAPWQPSPDAARGYGGWVRAAHLAAVAADEREAGHQTDSDARRASPAAGVRIRNPVADIAASASALVELAGRFVQSSYLWGGTSPAGFDCSGLVHYCFRRAGVVVPRDASAQLSVAEVVALGSELPGDLYFFARDDRVHHVGFVTGSRRMLHAPEDSADVAGAGRVEEVSMSPERLATLVGAGRLLPRG